MSDPNLKNKALNAAKWSSVTEILVKIASPITNMILARLLSPEAFGVVATVTMIVSFVDMFTDAGFQKYLVQHEFNDDDQKYKYANVAFWTNLSVSLILWVLVLIFSEPISVLVGNPGLGNVIVIACMQLPLTTFSSIQMSLYRRDFDFKTLFLVKIFVILVPFMVTIPLAFLGCGYWALIVGSIFTQFLNALILTIKSKWRPTLYYDFKILKDMLSFSIWSLIEAISIWLTAWVDAFMIGLLLNQHYLGLYRTSKMMVNSLMNLVISSIVPVLFATLSRLQNDEVKFKNFYLKVQRLASVLIFPLGIGMYLYSDLATSILLGNQWNEASDIIGIWALTSSISIVFGYFSSEVYRAKGKPRLSFVAQLLHLAVLVPAIAISARYGFWSLVYTRSLIRLQMVLIHFILLRKEIGIKIAQTFKNVSIPLISAILMSLLAYILKRVSPTTTWSILSIGICAVFYIGILLLHPKMRKELLDTFEKMLYSKLKNKLRIFNATR